MLVHKNHVVLVKLTKKLCKYFLLCTIVLLTGTPALYGQSKETHKRTEKSLKIKRKQKKEYEKSQKAEVKRRKKMQSKETQKRMRKSRKKADAFNKRKGKSKFNKKSNKPRKSKRR